jgi:hypothetical protein
MNATMLFQISAVRKTLACAGSRSATIPAPVLPRRKPSGNRSHATAHARYMEARPTASPPMMRRARLSLCSHPLSMAVSIVGHRSAIPIAPEPSQLYRMRP